MKVLVTGGAGFIGSHIVDLLLERGDDVIVVDNLSTGQETHLRPEVTFYRMDITDHRLSDVVAETRPEVVIHQAAQIDVPTSVQDPLHDARTNIIGTLNLLEACRNAGVRKVVYASSAAVYGNPEYLPIDEKHPVAPLSGYGISKHTPEHYLQVYAQLHGLAYTVLRYANVYGIRQDPRGEGGVISIFIEKVLKGEPITVFGDGEQTRDYIYVEDVARANVAALINGDGQILNIGTGQKTSINELIALFEEVSGQKMEIHHAPDRPGDIKHSYFDNRRAMEMLNWRPETELSVGLRKTLTYYRERITG